MRGRKDGAELEWAKDGEPAYAVRTGSGGSSKPMIAYAPDKAATLTAGISRTPGVNPPGRRQEDDYNVICVTGDKTHTLTAEGADASEDGTGRGTPIVYQCHGSNVGPMGTLRQGNGAVTGGVPFMVDEAIAFDWQTAGSERTRPNISTERTSTVQCTNRDAVLDGYGVRRLTPMECERLQGYPDEYTDGQSDAQRYRQMGNSVAIPVVSWIANGVVEVDAHL